MTRPIACFPEALGEHRVSPPSVLRSRQRPRDPAGRCYELAARYFLDHGGKPDVRLVHGLVRTHLDFLPPDNRMMHAWVELPGDLVYDRGQFFAGAGYRHVMQPIVARRWSSRLGWADETLADQCWGACRELVELQHNRSLLAEVSP
jgi:hypothetical protein